MWKITNFINENLRNISPHTAVLLFSTIKILQKENIISPKKKLGFIEITFEGLNRKKTQKSYGHLGWNYLKLRRQKHRCQKLLHYPSPQWRAQSNLTILLNYEL